MKFGSKKAIFGVIWGGFEGFEPCLGISHPTHPHLGKISQKNVFFYTFPYLIFRSFTLLNHCRDTSLYAKAGSPSILFLTAFTGDGDDGRFLTRDEATSVAGLDDLKQKRMF